MRTGSWKKSREMKLLRHGPGPALTDQLNISGESGIFFQAGLATTRAVKSSQQKR
jgi:hypothetical protein